MRYALFAGLLLAGTLAGVPGASAQDGGLPAGVRGLQAPQVVKRVLDLRAALTLTEPQVAQLITLHAGYQEAPAGFTNPGPKTRHAGRRPVTSGAQAYRRAAAILTAAQRAAAFLMLDQAPVRATAAAAAPDPLVHQTGEARPSSRGLPARRPGIQSPIASSG